MIEDKLFSRLKQFSGVSVHPFEIPDTEKGDAIAFQRLATRTTNKMYVSGQYDEGLFIIVYRTKTYIGLTENTKELMSLNNWTDTDIVFSKIDSYQDYKTTFGYERHFRLSVRYLQTY